MGGTQTHLGIGLRMLSEREADALGLKEAGTARLEEAVVAFRAALEAQPRERAPLDWAWTQTHLGIGLRMLSEREVDALGLKEAGTARLEQAVAAFRAALEEYTRERAPLDWAWAQTRLGIALRVLSQEEAGTARLEEAVAAFRAVLGVYTRERAPLDWAWTQSHLGITLWVLGERTHSVDHLEAAYLTIGGAHEIFIANDQRDLDDFFRDFLSELERDIAILKRDEAVAAP